MNCAEFHKELPYYIESGGNPEAEAHVRSCPNCADLVADLKYIAEQAKLLLPMRDPSPRVWQNIKASLEEEGLASPSRRRGPGAPERIVPFRKQWGSMGWVAAAAAIVLVAAAALLFTGGDRSPEVASNAPAPAVAGEDLEQDDVQLLKQLDQATPDMRPVYERNLRNVNTYIRQARQSVESDPDNAEARDHLIQAYAQKAMLYEMAVSRSME